MSQKERRLREVGAKLRALREERDVTATQVGAALEMAAETYRLYERGISALRVDQLFLIAEVFGLPLPDLLGRLGLLDAPVWSAYDALTEAGVPEDAAREQAEFVAGRAEIDQRAYVRAYLDLWRTQSAESTQTGNCRRPA